MKEKQSKSIIWKLVIHLRNILGLSGLRVLSVILQAIYGITTIPMVLWCIFVVVVIGLDLTGISPMYNSHILYPLIIGLTVISLILYSAIAYVSDYLMQVADKLHYDWSPKVKMTTEEPTVHVIYQSHQHDPTDEIIVEGEYTESSE